MLSAARKGEIALLALKEQICENGIHDLKPNAIRRQSGNMAKKLGITDKEMSQFSREIVAEVLSEAYEAKVTIDASHNA